MPVSASKILPYAVMKIDGFSHIQKLPAVTVHKVNTGVMGKLFQFFFNAEFFHEEYYNMYGKKYLFLV